MQGIVGQQQAREVLQRQLASGRMHHGYIFHGPSGVGKFTTALGLAKVLLCHQRQTNLAGKIEACDRCASCQLFNAPREHVDRPEPGSPSAGKADSKAAKARSKAGKSKSKAGKPQADADPTPQAGASAMSFAHPDLHAVSKELAHYAEDSQTRNRKLRTIPVEVIRQSLIGPAYRAAIQSHGQYGKVFIVDEAELMDRFGQNALLKTLEEPPRVGGGTTIILISANEERLLPTIRSRCQRIAFTRLDDSAVRTWLDALAGHVGHDSPTDAGLETDSSSAADSVSAAGSVSAANSSTAVDPSAAAAAASANAAKAADPAQIHAAKALKAPERDWLVRFAEGSLGRAQLALDYGLSDWAKTIIPAIDQMAQGRAVGKLGGELASMIGHFAEAWVNRHAGASKEAANQLAAALCMGVIASEARWHLARVLDEVQRGDLLAGEAAAGPWLSVIDTLGQAEANLRANVNLSLTCDHLALTIGRALR